MPQRSAYRKKTTKKAQRQVPKPVKAYVRRELRIAAAKESPLCWTDIIFDGGNVNTTPTIHSFVAAICGKIADEAEYWTAWPSRQVQGGTTTTFSAKLRVSYVHYQLRYQQDAENIEDTNTFRWLMYSFTDTWSENPDPLLDGGDIDRPPRTDKVVSMYFDKMATLRAGYSDIGGAAPVPGTRIFKGNKRLNKVFNLISDRSTLGWENDDIRWESQSDTVGDGLQLYGFIRLYYRLIV